MLSFHTGLRITEILKRRRGRIEIRRVIDAQRRSRGHNEFLARRGLSCLCVRFPR